MLKAATHSTRFTFYLTMPEMKTHQSTSPSKTSSFNVFCEYMDLPGFHHKTFQSIAERIFSAIDDIRNIFSRAAYTVR
ncbi:hypothetical protein RRG08_027906 [Elysia crispata]|uniref:Uncharacterized protein n=1 Tax=Elysia crispata TaxID=231223 RepID=A0AAE1A7D2_9GAST|nr:hypothetical protein RRG08_027906 [Elysia crispata]